jgi:non-specific serine/threonine protein kinase
MYGGDLERSKVVLEESLALARRHKLPSAIPQPLAHLGLRAALAGDLTESLQLLQEARDLAQALQDDHQVSFTLAALGYRSLVEGNLQEAADLFSAAVAQFRARGNEASATVVQFSLAVTMQRLGKLDEAVHMLQDGLQTTLAFRNRWQLSHGLEATVLLVGDRTDAEKRARLVGALDTLTQTTGAQYGTLARVSGQDTTNHRDQPEQERLEMARRAGRSLPFPEIVALALAVLHDFAGTLDRRETAAQERGRTMLSPREQEVLRLVAEGLSNKLIAKELIIAESTAKYYVTGVFNKLGVDSRAQAVAVAAQRGLL